LSKEELLAKDLIEVQKGSKDLPSLISIDDFLKYLSLFKEISKLSELKVTCSEFTNIEDKFRLFANMHDFLVLLIENFPQIQDGNVKKLINETLARFKFGGVPIDLKLTSSQWIKVFVDYGYLYCSADPDAKNAFTLSQFLGYLNYIKSIRNFVVVHCPGDENYPRSFSAKDDILLSSLLSDAESISNTEVENLEDPAASPTNSGNEFREKKGHIFNLQVEDYEAIFGTPALPDNFPKKLFNSMYQLFRTIYRLSKQSKDTKVSLLSNLKDIKIAYSIYMKIPGEISQGYINRLRRGVKVNIDDDKVTVDDFKVFVERLIAYSLCETAREYSKCLQ